MKFIHQQLPEYLSERTRWVASGDTRGDFVLYWMRTAVRTDENPALDVARLIASLLAKPLLIYQGISEHYDFASDRHHTFMLQGAGDVQVQCRQLGLSYAFFLATPQDRRPHLIDLADRAAVMVTEDMPVDPPRRFLDVVVRKTRTATCCVDTACVVPMQVVGKAFARAFQFREATQSQYAERVTRSWPIIDAKATAVDLRELPFEPVDLRQCSIPELVSRCEIDHAVGPVLDTMGGSTAGYARWKEFKGQGLTQYAKQRNNALADGVSRMSAYLHYGMVSPMRLAREAAQCKTAGAEKYLDELLIWRELAYTFCFYTPNHDSWPALPSWAQETLDDHARDDREETYSWEQLARGQTSNRLWNAAQRSLLMHGELHNNLRMTWGKAILNWMNCPRQALQMVLDLNHRYALDGRDPASFGGILWCFGQFDRPFSPEVDRLGTVRPRPLNQHANRLDPEVYEQKVDRVRFNSVGPVAVIGAGLSGLFAARTLQDHGLSVQVFDKSRGVGGRMATRRLDDGRTFDHGAQYFTVRDQRFRRYLESWLEQEVVRPWPAGSDKIAIIQAAGVEYESSPPPRFVGNPTMNAICRHLATNLSIEKQARIVRIERDGDEYRLMCDDGRQFGGFSGIICSAPAEQSSALLQGLTPLASQIEAIKMNPCWAGMYTFKEPVSDRWAGAFIHDSFLKWAAQNHTKPNRNAEAATLVLHADPDWTRNNWDRNAMDILAEMLNEFWRVTSLRQQTPIERLGHRWKYSIAEQPSDVRCFCDHEARIVACGDWASGSRVEGAFLSGMAAAGRIMGTLKPKQGESRQVQDQLF